MPTIRFPLLLCACLLSACASPRHQTQPGGPALAAEAPARPQPAQSIPYPQLSRQNQIDQLGIQVARLEREIGLLQTRIRQIESQAKPPRTAARRPTTPIQRLDDSKLKSDYLAGGGSAVHLTDEVGANENRLYNQASKYYQSGNFAAAASILRGADGGNGSDSARRNMYLLLQSHQRMGNCESAIEIGGRYANRFRGSAEAPEALFGMGQCQYDMQQKDIARSTWRKLIQTYPDSPAAKRAAVRIKQR